MSPLLQLVLLSMVALGTAVWVARRDALVGGFMVFFFLYVIIALVGYQFFPLVSIALNLYLGPQVFPVAVRFVALSFLAFTLAFVLLHPRLVRPGWIRVRFVDAPKVTLVAGVGIASLLAWMLTLFLRDYDRIAYGNDPQIPSVLLALAFKQTPMVILALWAFTRHHAAPGPLRQLGALLLLAATAVFAAIAAKSGNRTDVVAVGVGLVAYELWPILTDGRGGLRARALIPDWPQVRTFALVGLVVAGAGWFITRNYASRGSADAELPRFARVLYNDYFTPAHMLFGAIGLEWIRPADVVRSNAANAVFLGRVTGQPYLQQDIGNTLSPGSSTRSGSFGYYIFTEGYMFAGEWGFLYNGLIPLLGLLLWRRLSTTSAPRANQFWAAFTAMFFLNVARSQSALILRYLLLNGIPACILFGLVSGARLGRVRAA